MSYNRMVCGLVAAFVIFGGAVWTAPAKAQGLVEYALILVIVEADPGAFGLSVDPPNPEPGQATSVLECDGSVVPADGVCEAETTAFQLTIGNANWDEEVPFDSLIVFTGLEVAAVEANITLTKPEHPDLILSRDNTFVARDVVFDPGSGSFVPNGEVSGTYSIANAQFIPIGPSVLLLLPGLAMLLVTCRRCA